MQEIDEARVEQERRLPWMPIDTAPKDGTRVRLHRIGLKGIGSAICRTHRQTTVPVTSQIRASRVASRPITPTQTTMDKRNYRSAAFRAAPTAFWRPS